MKKISFRLFSVSTCLAATLAATLPSVRADEGMWTFDNPPVKQLKERYGFEPSKDWLDHVRLSAVRLNNGGSGSFVSPDGLVMTNHHVARSLLAKLSTAQRDLLKTGFYARTRDEELKCQDLEINVLVGMDNVTERVQGAGRATDAKAAEKARKEEIARIEKEASESSGLRCNVVTLYEGGEYWLYRFRKYTDIRIVFAPEEQAAAFGGDYDNFCYPRWGLDVAFLRVYENGAPVKLDHYFRWSKAGAADGELVFAVGNPGSTDRLRTVAQIEYQRDYANPMAIRSLERRRAALIEFGKGGPERERQAADTIAGINNSLKRLLGQQEGLLDPKVMGRKVAEEKDLRDRVAANPELRRTYGTAWDEMALVYKKLAPMAKRVTFSSLSNSKLADWAVKFVQFAAETRKPNGDRLEAYRDSNLASLKFQLLSSAPVYPEFEEAVLAARLQEIRDELGATDPFVKAALGGRSAKDVAKELIGGTKLADPAFRKQVIDMSPEELAKVNDPLLAMARAVDPILRDLDKWNRETIESARIAAGQRIAAARFAAYGKTISPDANFTMRFAYGVVKGYEFNTTLVPYRTTFYGLYDRADSFAGKSPFDLAPALAARKGAVELSTPMNFVYTADTIGGNSGSPVINRNAEVVGIHFDSNTHRFVSRYLYTEDRGRAVAVHSAGIIEALRKVYDAGPLADEIEGKH